MDRLRCLLGFPRFVSRDLAVGHDWVGAALVVQVCVSCHTSRGAHRGI